MLKRMFAIAMVALIASACSSSKQVVRSEVRGLKAEVRVDSVVVGTMEAIRDTVVEVTTVTIRENEQGDTVRVSTVTDRLRVRDHEAFGKKEMKTEVVRDTVFIVKRDSVLVKNTNVKSRDSPLVTVLRWGCGVIVALIGLGIVLRIRR